jgi:hypothetical protein
MKQATQSNPPTPHRTSKGSQRKAAQPVHWLNNLRLQASILAVLAALMYLQTLSYEYVLDDRMFITEHKAVRSGVQGIPELLTKHNMYSSNLNINQGRYRPLTFITFALEQQIAPMKPVLGHCVNVALYALTALVLLVVLRKLLGGRHPAIAFAATLLFVLHPIHTEVVANIKSRDLLLSLLFGLLALRSLLAYHLDGEHPAALAWGALWTALSLLSQEGAVTFLAVFPLSIYFFTDSSVRKNVLSCAPLFAAGAAVLAIRAVVVGQTDDSWMQKAVNYLYLDASPMDALATKTAIMGRYLLNVAFPFVMAHDYGYRQLEIISWFGNASSWQAIASLVAHLALIGWALWKLPTKHILSFCVLWYCATMAITSNFFIYYGMPMSDRLLYAPSVAWAIAFAWLLAEAFKLNTPPFRLSLPSGSLACVAVIGLLYGVRTVVRNPAWQSDFTLNKAGAEDAPRCIGTKIEYARLCLLKTGTTTNPAEQQELMQTAYTQLHEAIALDPKAMAAAYSWMANYFTSYKLNYDSAVYYSSRAAQVEPEFQAFHYNEYVARGDSAAAAKNYARAIQMYRKMLDFPDLQPDVANVKLGIAYALQKQYDSSLPYFQKALQLNPNNPSARNNFLYVQQQRQRVADSLKARSKEQKTTIK